MVPTELPARHSAALALPSTFHLKMAYVMLPRLRCRGMPGWLPPCCWRAPTWNGCATSTGGLRQTWNLADLQVGNLDCILYHRLEI